MQLQGKNSYILDNLSSVDDAEIHSTLPEGSLRKPIRYVIEMYIAPLSKCEYCQLCSTVTAVQLSEIIRSNAAMPEGEKH